MPTVEELLKKHGVKPAPAPRKYTENRRCSVPGCDRLGQNTGKRRKDGTVIRRAKCAKHHSIQYGIRDWSYKRYRKTYCENRDGRLGFRCTTTIIDPDWQLDADHINGNPHDNTPENIQTLCRCCHAIKTRDSRDWLTRGRSSVDSSADQTV